MKTNMLDRTYRKAIKECEIIYGKDYMMRNIFINIYQWFRMFPLIIQFYIDRNGVCISEKERQENYIKLRQSIAQIASIEMPNLNILETLEGLRNEN